MEREELAAILQGYEYLLVERQLAQQIDLLVPSDVRVSDAVIYDPRSGTEIHSHQQVQVEILNRFSLDEIESVELSGKRIVLVNDQSIVVSTDLKQCLERPRFSYLKFEEGPGIFVGGEI